jgi:HEPN domain-containing protein
MVEMDRAKHASYWRTGAGEDLAAAKDMVARGHVRHGLFFLHLAVEKTLKGLLVHSTGTIPPKSHDLVQLAERAGVDLPDDTTRLMLRISRYCMEGRYPDRWVAPPDEPTATAMLGAGEELLRWLDRKF